MMKYKLITLTLTVFLFGCSQLTEPPQKIPENTEQPVSQVNKTGATTTADGKWVTAYLASYNHYAPPGGNWGNLPTDEIDWDAFTHLNYFAFNVNSDGTLSEILDYHNMSPDRINAIVSAAHENGKPVLFTIGGWGNYEGFSTAISPIVRPVFIANLVSILTTWGFDGIDVDMEPINSGDEANYVAFINELHTALQAVDTPLLNDPLLTVATNWHADMFAGLQDKIDQINLMTYDYSGAWQGWTTWHNSPVYNGGETFPNLDKTLPSIDKTINQFLQAGVSPGKLGIGIDFYGYLWDGVSDPQENWTTAPTVTDNVPYHKIMADFYQDKYRKWDSNAQATYLSINENGTEQFVSYDDEQSIQAKYDYMMQKNLGGAIIWELSGGYRENQPAGERDELLQSVKQTFMNGTPGTTKDTTPPTLTVTNPSDGSTVSGSVNFTVDATDNIGVTSVEFAVNGNAYGSPLTAAPYSVSVNSTDLADGTHNVSATATDDAGNQTTVSVTIEVANNSTEPGDPTEGTYAYDDALNGDWINSSWSANVDFSNSATVYTGSQAVRVVQKAWGALSLHNGPWGAAVDVLPGSAESLNFAVYPDGEDAKFSVRLQNDNGDSFPKVQHGTVPANQWTVVSMPMSELNPNGNIIHRINILETSGSRKTYYIDEILFSGSTTSGETGIDAPVAPVLSSPASGAETDTGLTLAWNSSVDAATYDLQIATDNSFAALQTNVTGLTSTSYTVTGLENSTTYYWRVRAGNSAGQSNWSEIATFTTEAKVITGQATPIYDEALLSPWINSSWSASVSFSNSELPYNGTKSVKVSQSAWGALSLHSGSWGSAVDAGTANYSSLEFMVYAATGDIQFNISLQNDDGGSFPKVKSETISGNGWVKISIPVDDLNPQNLAVHRLNLQEISGASQTYYVDNIQWVD
ncbi:MAG: fibronectin type III domain-containing protein [Candidatus Marinimicrobia bacterium]|nr:fibronectin type III domain-containing protein [Candidatus Neomarinimicrobiota bacterium]